MSELIRRIPSSVIDQIPPPVTSRIAPPVVDALTPPVVDFIQPPVVDVPSYEPPTYEPPDVPEEAPSAEVGGVQQEPEREEEPAPARPELGVPELPATPATPQIPAERPELEVPFIGTVPLPYPREVTLAGTTAVAATGAALAGKSLVEFLVKVFKPIVRRIMLRIKEKRGLQFSDFELQDYFQFEGTTPELKRLKKALKREFEEERLQQVEAEVQRQRQRKQMHRETTDESGLLDEQPHHNEAIEQVRNQVEP